MATTDPSDLLDFRPRIYLPRARGLLAIAKNLEAGDHTGWNATLLGAIFLAVAAYENWRELADKRLLPMDRQELEDLATRDVRHFQVMTDLRVQAFHRHPVTFIPKSAGVDAFTLHMGRGTKLTAAGRQGFVQLRIVDGIPTVIKSPGSSGKLDRAVSVSNDTVLDEALGQYVHVYDLIEEYIGDTEEALLPKLGAFA